MFAPSFRPLRSAPLFAVSLALSVSLSAQDPGATGQLTQEFGGGDGQPGYRVWFDATGASVRRIELLDHDGERLERMTSGERSDYPVVIEELADPGDASRGIRPWLRLREAAGGGTARFAAPLDVAKWEMSTDDAGAVTFRYDDGTSDVILEKTFAYDGEQRRDLRIRLALRAREGVTPVDAGRRWSFDLDGVALFTPAFESLYGNASMAVGSALDAEGEPILEVHRGLQGPVDEVPTLVASGSGRFSFAGATSRFFGAFLYPEPGDEAAQRAVLSSWLQLGPAVAQSDMEALSVAQPVYRLSLEVPPAGEVREATFRLYLGPKDVDAFSARPEYERFNSVVEEALAPPCFCSVPGTKTLGSAMLALLSLLQSLVGNWGLAIMCLTVIVRGLLFPLNFRMQKSMRAYGAKMAVLKPKMDELQKRYANNPQELRQKMQAFHAEHKLFPPVGGCLPIFLTMPVYLGLFSAIRVSYDLRQQPFFGWIDDLSRPDALFQLDLDLGLFSLDSFNLLPFVYMALMLYLTTRTPLPKDEQQRQVARMTRLMPMLFGVMLYGYAAGMFVYMITSGLFALLEQRIVKKVLGPMQPDAAGMAAAPVL